PQQRKLYMLSLHDALPISAGQNDSGYNEGPGNGLFLFSLDFDGTYVQHFFLFGVAESGIDQSGNSYDDENDRNCFHISLICFYSKLYSETKRSGATQFPCRIGPGTFPGRSDALPDHFQDAVQVFPLIGQAGYFMLAAKLPLFA